VSGGQRPPKARGFRMFEGKERRVRVAVGCSVAHPENKGKKGVPVLGTGRGRPMPRALFTAAIWRAWLAGGISSLASPCCARVMGWEATASGERVILRT